MCSILTLVYDKILNELNKKPAAAASKTNSDSKLTSQNNEEEIEQPFNIEEPLEESLPLPAPTRTKKQVQAPVLMSVSDFMGKSSSSSTTPTVDRSIGAVSAQGVEGNRRGGEIIREVEGGESKEGSEDEEDWDEGSGEEEGSGEKKKRKGGKIGGKEQKVISGKDGLPQVIKSGGGDGDLKEDGNSAPSPKGILKNTTTDKGGKSVQFTQEVIQEDKAKKPKKKKEEEEEEEPPKRVSLFRQRMQGGNN